MLSPSHSCHWQRICLWTLVISALLLSGCGGEKYKGVMDAAGAQLSSLAMREDHLHQLRLQEALASNPDFSRLSLSTYVFMDRGYVIGYVNSAEQAKAVFEVAKTVEGLRSLDAYLPVKHTAANDGVEPQPAVLKAKIKAALAQTPGVVDTRVSVEVLDDRAVLLGVVSDDEEKTRVERAAAETIGVTHVTNWLLVPESQYMAIRTQVF